MKTVIGVVVIAGCSVWLQGEHIIQPLIMMSGLLLVRVKRCYGNEFASKAFGCRD